MYDIAIRNLYVARGLPDTKDFDIPAQLNKLDQWAERVKLEIWRHIYRFDLQAHQPPTEFSYGNAKL